MTKTTSGRRSIKLLGPALEALKAQKAFTYRPTRKSFRTRGRRALGR
ncbi:hypothetical protein P4133_10890 [Pseudomonas aeruginosa]|nr:hypothetical protein [Pseudomonas aeruginosa]